MQKTAIIIPCYNEEKRLDLIKFIEALNKNSYHHYFFIDDGSQDGTWMKLQELIGKNPTQVHIFQLKKNMGKAEAVRQGFLKAFDLNYEFIGFWDADLATPLSAINDFLNIMDNKKINIVMGSRVRLLGRNIRRSASRHYLGRFFATFVSIIFGISVYDTQCGAKIFRNTAEIKWIFSNKFKSKWIFDVEILARYKYNVDSHYNSYLTNSIVEFPLLEWFDITGSKLRMVDFILAACDLVKIYIDNRNLKIT